jgi:hypothetical protein
LLLPVVVLVSDSAVIAGISWNSYGRGWTAWIAHGGIIGSGILLSRPPQYTSPPYCSICFFVSCAICGRETVRTTASSPRSDGLIAVPSLLRNAAFKSACTHPGRLFPHCLVLVGHRQERCLTLPSSLLSDFVIVLFFFHGQFVHGRGKGV